jgi:hypothetical protein
VIEMVKPFMGLFGNSSELKLIHSLLPMKEMEFNITDLKDLTDLTRPVITRIVKKFAEWGILEVASKSGNVNFYMLNNSSPFVILFKNLNSKIIEQMLDEDTLNEVYVHRQHRLATTKAICDVRAVQNFPFEQWVTPWEPAKAIQPLAPRVPADTYSFATVALPSTMTAVCGVSEGVGFIAAR